MNTTKNKLIAAIVVTIIVASAYAVGAAQIFVPQKAIADPVLYSADTVTSIYENASPAVVEIDTTQQAQGFFNPTMEGIGSGFLVDTDGYILTNNHVVDGATNVKVTLKGGNTVDAKVVATDAIDDLAVISIDPSAVTGITALQFSDSTAVKPGQMAIAIGNPYGLDSTVTVGVISGLNRNIGGMTGMLQTDAAINPGNSGGPLLDANGLVIGINTAIESSATGAVGIGFAVPSNVAQTALPELKAGKQVVRPWIGISGVALTQTLAQQLGLSVNQGVYVVSVNPVSPAEKAGLKGGNLDTTGAPAPGGDIITTVDGNSVSSVQDISNYINTRNVGDNITLSVLRNGSNTDVQVTLGTWPTSLTPGGSPRITPQPQPQPQPGIPGPGWKSRLFEGNRD
jgi:S1-C subfamily serine protease